MRSIDYVIIPARGGSKRIKNKNICEFLGRPMIFRAIDVAQDVSRNVVVSSDSDLILSMVRSEFSHCILHDRPVSLATDSTPTLPVITEVLNNLQVSHDAVVCVLYPTAMFASSEHLRNALYLLQPDCYVVSVVKNDKCHRTFAIKNGRMQITFDVTKRTQDFCSMYNDAGQFYIGYARNFLDGVPLLGGSSCCYDIGICCDIDTMSDLLIAQAIYSFLRGKV